MKKILRFGLVAAFAGVLVTGCTQDDEPFGLMQEEAAIEAPAPMFNGVILPTPPSTVVPLTADGPDEGFDLDVGTVTLTNDANNLYVALLITDLDWCLVKVHLDVADTPDDLPQTRKGNPIPGQFAYSATYALDYPCEQAPDPFVVPLDGWTPGTELYVAVHTEVVSAVDGCYEEDVWQIGDVEVVNAGTGWLENYADEFNWVGATPTTAGPGLSTIEPPFTDPFIVGTTPTSEFPYNSNKVRGYATDFDVQWFGGLPFGGKLTVSWSPGASAAEKKIVSSGDGIATTEWTAAGSNTPNEGWFLNKYPLVEDYVTVDPIATDDHTIRFQHTEGDGTFWDWLLLQKACERNETAWAEGEQFPGNNWGMYIGYEVVLVVGGWDAARGGFSSFPTTPAFGGARTALEAAYDVEYRTFNAVSGPALDGVHLAILGSVAGNSSGQTITVLSQGEQDALYAFADGGGCEILITDGSSFNVGNNSLTAAFGLATPADPAGLLSGQNTATLLAAGTYETNFAGYYSGEGTGGTTLAVFVDAANKIAAVEFTGLGPVFAFSDINTFWTKTGPIGLAFEDTGLLLDAVEACFD